MVKKKVLFLVLALLALTTLPALANKNVFSCRVELGRFSYQSCFVESPIFSLGNTFSLSLGFDLTRPPSSEILATLYTSLYLGLGSQWIYLDLGPTLAFNGSLASSWGDLSYKLRLVYGFYW